MGPADDLLTFLDASPSPYHATAEASRRLVAAGFVEHAMDEEWPAGGLGFVRRGGALVAWAAASGDPTRPFRIVGAHTDSPNLRVTPRPDTGREGFRQLGVAPYGGLLYNSWLDRDLGLSGRVAVRGPNGIEERLFRDDRPLLRVPQLAIHLDRDVNTAGLKLNPQQHLVPVWGLGTAAEGDFVNWLADLIDAEPADVLAWDAMAHDTLPAGFLGADEDLISAARLDDQCSCFGAISALTDVVHTVGDTGSVPVVALFDHEEVGSGSVDGAAGPLLGNVLERVVFARGGTRDDLLRAISDSALLSADMAHGTHPNYPDRHEPNHHIVLGGGPVLKVNVQQRYASEAALQAELVDTCEAAGIPVQLYSHRADLACGSTIGPILAAGVGIPTVDMGMAQLSMHSIRELMATADVSAMVDTFSAWMARAGHRGAPGSAESGATDAWAEATRPDER